MKKLREIGLNRMSLGVQDFNPDVQKAVNRIQPFEMTKETMDAARAEGFHSINMDLIYGLPKQTRETFAQTIDQVLELSPDRIALYHYAHLPNHFKPQRRILPADLPDTVTKVHIMFDAIKRLTANGYRYIGMDHFAKIDDELACADRRYAAAQLPRLLDQSRMRHGRFGRLLHLEDRQRLCLQSPRTRRLGRRH